MAALIIAATCVTAQSTSFGIKAGTNMSSYLLYDIAGSISMKVGAEISGFLKHDFNEYFAIQPEISFVMQNSEYKVDTINNDYIFWGMEVPVYALGQLTTAEDHRAYIGIGPVFSAGFSGKERNTDFNLFNEKDGEAALSRWDIGGAVLIGYEFAFNMQINISYKYGFFNALNPLNPLENANDDARMVRNSISLGIGYRF